MKSSTTVLETTAVAPSGHEWAASMTERLAEFAGATAKQVQQNTGGTTGELLLQEVRIPVLGGDVSLSRESGQGWSIGWSVSIYLSGDVEMDVPASVRLVEVLGKAVKLAEALNGVDAL